MGMEEPPLAAVATGKVMAVMEMEVRGLVCLPHSSVYSKR